MKPFFMERQMTGPIDKNRFENIKRLALEGMTCVQIAEIYGVTRQAISLTLNKGRVIRQKKIILNTFKQKLRDKIDARYKKEFGLGYTEMFLLRELGITRQYASQRRNAQQRGIEWLFTICTWWDVWEKSGKWDSRGKKKGQYVMGRNGDVGPYSPENVYIITCSENIKEVRDREKIERRKI